MRDPNRPLLPLPVRIAIGTVMLFFIVWMIAYWYSSDENNKNKNEGAEQWPTSATTSRTESKASITRKIEPSVPSTSDSPSPVPADLLNASSSAAPLRDGKSPSRILTLTSSTQSDDPLPNISIPFRFSPSAFPKAPPSDAEFEWNARAMTFEFYLNNAKVPTLKKTHKLTGKLSDVCWQVTIAKPDLPFTMRVRAVVANTQGKAFETGAAKHLFPKETDVNVGVKVNPCALSDWEEANVQRIVSEGKRRAVH